MYLKIIIIILLYIIKKLIFFLFNFVAMPFIKEFIKSNKKEKICHTCKQALILSKILKLVNNDDKEIKLNLKKKNNNSHRRVIHYECNLCIFIINDFKRKTNILNITLREIMILIFCNFSYNFENELLATVPFIKKKNI